MPAKWAVVKVHVWRGSGQWLRFKRPPTAIFALDELSSLKVIEALARRHIACLAGLRSSALTKSSLALTSNLPLLRLFSRRRASASTLRGNCLSESIRRHHRRGNICFSIRRWWSVRPADVHTIDETQQEPLLPFSFAFSFSRSFSRRPGPPANRHTLYAPRK